jgi:hypothetical protein
LEVTELQERIAVLGEELEPPSIVIRQQSRRTTEQVRRGRDVAACERAMAGRRKPALAALEKAVELGFRNAQLLRTDVRFASIRETPEFGVLLARTGGES